MFRRRTPLPLSAAAAVLAVSPLLTACGSEAHPGAAAIVDGERITVEQVQARVEAVRDAQRATEQGDRLIENTSQLARGALHSMVFRRVLERAAEDAGVEVARGDVQRALEEAERSMGGAKALQRTALQQQAIPPEGISEVIRIRLLVQRLGERLGADQRTPQGQQVIQKALTEASRELGIEINPRYGTWNEERTSLGDTELPWIKEVTNPRQPA